MYSTLLSFFTMAIEGFYSFWEILGSSLSDLVGDRVSNVYRWLVNLFDWIPLLGEWYADFVDFILFQPLYSVVVSGFSLFILWSLVSWVIDLLP